MASYRHYAGAPGVQGPRAAKHPQRRRVTPRQGAVLVAIQDSLRRLGYAPSLREIGLAIGCSANSTNGISEHLDRLELKGLVTRVPFQTRAISITAAGRAWLLQHGPRADRPRERETDPGSIDEGEA